MSSLVESIHDVSRWLHAVWRWSTLFGLATIGLVWASLGINLQVERDAAERVTARISDNLARALDRNVSNSLEEIDRLLLTMRRGYMLYPDGFHFVDWLSTSQFSDGQVFQFGIVGPDGFLKLSTNPAFTARPIDISDRDHFRFHVDGNDDRLFISKPVVGQMTGKVTLQLTRRIHNADGSFGGVVTASIDPEYFARFYNSFDLGSNGRIAIVGTDGIVRAVGGGVPDAPGQDLSSRSLFERLAQSPAGWYYSTGQSSDHVPRLLTYRAVENYPLIVTVGVSTAAIFAQVDAKRQAYNLIATILTFFILVVTVSSIRGRTQLEQMSEQHRSQNFQFDLALGNMPHGLCMFDAKSRLVVCNGRYAEIYRLPPELQKVGTPHEVIIAHRVKNGLLRGGTGDDDVQQKLAQLSELSRHPTSSRIEELADGRFIRVVRSAIDGGGWVATHEDITEQKRAEQELDRAKRLLDTVIENLPLPIVVKDPETLNFVLINRAFENFAGISRDAAIGKSVDVLYPKAEAELVTRFDTEAIQSSDHIRSECFELETKANGRRSITATRLVVRDDAGRPQCLIVVIEDITEKKKAEQRLAFMAHHDALTGLANRVTLLERLEEAGARQRRWGEQFSTLVLDLDRFKIVNDTLGHPAGDALLKEVAARLKASLRETDVVARLGGDEFAIIQAREANQREAATSLASRILEAIAKPFEIEGNELTVGTSIGIAMAPEHGSDPQSLLKMADIALYRAKSEGRNGFTFFAPEMGAATDARHMLECDLRQAVAKNELELHYQPIIDAKTQRLCGVEALVRWRHPSKGLISPDQFIPLAEETGLIKQIGEWVLQTACENAATWPDFVRVAVNLSPEQFRKSDIADTVVRVLAESGLPGGRLELEITETALFDNGNECLAALNKIKSLGATIALDDFGTGYSSLSQLTMFPFDRIKIDRTFTRNMTRRADCAAIISAALTLAHSLDMTTTAEGVETPEQFKLLKLAGVSSVQGYLFGRPCRIEDIDFHRVYDVRKTGAAAA